MSSTIKLYEHNQKAYDALLDMLGECDRACVIKPTGTGKFVIIAKMVQDNPDKRFLLLGTCKSNVFRAMKNGSAVHGIHFYYGDEPKPVDSFFKPRRRRKVRCTETGVVYESIRDAAERTKISPNCIGSAVSGMAGGYHWEYADD